MTLLAKFQAISCLLLGTVSRGHGGLLRLCLSRVAGWGSPVQCLRLWVALGLGVGGVAGAFVLLNRPCYHDINIKELKFL